MKQNRVPWQAIFKSSNIALCSNILLLITSLARPHHLIGENLYYVGCSGDKIRKLMPRKNFSPQCFRYMQKQVHSTMRLTLVSQICERRIATPSADYYCIYMSDNFLIPIFIAICYYIHWSESQKIRSHLCISTPFYRLWITNLRQNMHSNPIVHDVSIIRPIYQYCPAFTHSYYKFHDIALRYSCIWLTSLLGLDFFL